MTLLLLIRYTFKQIYTAFQWLSLLAVIEVCSIIQHVHPTKDDTDTEAIFHRQQPETEKCLLIVSPSDKNLKQESWNLLYDVSH